MQITANKKTHDYDFPELKVSQLWRFMFSVTFALRLPTFGETFLCYISPFFLES